MSSLCFLSRGLIVTKDFVHPQTLPTKAPFILGGHSFIPELGNDPAADPEAQMEIVNTCLDRGICCFDTTYEPERVALGHILNELGRRAEAEIIAWNFSQDPNTGKYRVPATPYAPHHHNLMLGQFRTDFIDRLVV